MAYQTETTFPDTRSARLRILSALRTLRAALVHAAIRYGEIRSRRAQIVALEALSDAELAEMGLKRADIPRHVFRNVMTM